MTLRLVLSHQDMFQNIVFDSQFKSMMIFLQKCHWFLCVNTSICVMPELILNIITSWHWTETRFTKGSCHVLCLDQNVVKNCNEYFNLWASLRLMVWFDGDVL